MRAQDVLLFEAPLAHEVTHPTKLYTGLTYSSNSEFELEWENRHAYPRRLPSSDQEWEQETPPTSDERPIFAGVAGYPPYQWTVYSLPRDEREKLEKIADVITQRFQPGRIPIELILVVGYADLDTPRRPNFEENISGKRAAAVQTELSRLVRSRLQPDLFSKLFWRRCGAGASAVSSVHRKSNDRAVNRRVTIFLLPKPIKLFQ